jgi:protein-S-isoprenylcysteine O-methyltransferase
MVGGGIFERVMGKGMLIFLIVVAPTLALVLSCLGLETSKTNLMGWVLLVIGVGYIAGGIIYYWVKKGQVVVVRKETGDRSFWLILPGFLMVFFGSPLEYLYILEVLPRSTWMQWLGIVLIAAGVALRIWTRRAIKGLYSGVVQVRQDHRLVQEGPYRFIRHPGYAGFFLMALGISVAYSSLIGLLAILILFLPGLAYRMKVEEILLIGHFGGEYLNYRGKTKKVIPWIW